MSEREHEQLVRRVTELVLARLGRGGGAEPPSTRHAVWLLLPRAPLRLRELAAEVTRVRAAVQTVRTLAWPAALAELDQAGLRDQFQPGLQDASQAGLVESVRASHPCEIVFVAALGFATARRLVEMHDDDPLVRIVAHALLGGNTVLAAVDELLPRAPRVAGELVRRAEALRRNLEQLGITLVAGPEWEERVVHIAATPTDPVASVGDLLSEEDVGRLWAAGHRRLVLPPRTIVTPLARSRATELGIELVEKRS